MLFLVDVLNIFYFSSVSGPAKGRRSPRRKGGGGNLVFGNREGGRVSEDGRRGGAQRGWEGVAGGGGGLNIFFRGRNVRQVLLFRNGLLENTKWGCKTHFSPTGVPPPGGLWRFPGLKSYLESKTITHESFFGQ